MFVGMMVDLLIDTGLSAVVWLVLHHRDQRSLGLWVLVVIAVAYIAPRAIAFLVTWANLGVAMAPMWIPSARGLVEVLAAAAVAVLMWRITYRRVRTAVDAEVFT